MNRRDFIGSIGTVAAFFAVPSIFRKPPEPPPIGFVGSSSEIPEITLHLEKSPITVKTRKLKAVWSVELAQDLKAVHGLDFIAPPRVAGVDYLYDRIGVPC